MRDLTLDKAAAWLSLRLGEPVNAAGLLSLALDGQLLLSVFLPANTNAIPDDAERFRSLRSPNPEPIGGVWELEMTGDGRRQVEHELHKLSGRPFIGMRGAHGATVKRGEIRYQLIPDSGGANAVTASWLASALPPGSYIVVTSDALAACASRLTTAIQKTAQVRQSATWEDVTIQFISDERVQITIGQARDTGNYEEMGFANQRTGAPNFAWNALKKLAEGNGAVRVSATERSKIEKRTQEIRKLLRQYVQTKGISVDPASEPLPYDSKAHEYRAVFKIGVRKAFDT